MLLVVVALAGSLVGSASTAFANGPCPTGQPCVVVHVTGAVNSVQVVTLADIDQGDLSQPAYQTRARADRAPQGEPRPSRALSIRQLLERLPTPVAPGSVSFTESPNRSGGTSYLRGRTHDLDEPGGPQYPFQDGLMPAVYAVGNNDAIGYIRPLRGGSDTNASDFWQTDSTGVLELTVHTTGDVVTPTLHVRPSATEVGRQVAFSATFDQPPSGAASYTWQFGDGGSVTTGGPSTTHAYRVTGTSYASVGVRGEDGSVGQSAPVLVTVGARPPKEQGPPRTGTGSSTKPPALATGPDHSVGTRSGTRPSSTSGDTASSAPDSSSPGSVGGPGAGAATRSTPRTHRTHRQRSRTRPERQQPLVAGQAEGIVEGVVIGGPEVLQSVAAATSPTTASATAPAARQGRRAARFETVAWVGASLMLLGLGALGEVRGTRRGGRRPQ